MNLVDGFIIIYLIFINTIISLYGGVITLNYYKGFVEKNNRDTHSNPSDLAVFGVMVFSGLISFLGGWNLICKLPQFSLYTLLFTLVFSAAVITWYHVFQSTWERQGKNPSRLYRDIVLLVTSLVISSGNLIGAEVIRFLLG